MPDTSSYKTRQAYDASADAYAQKTASLHPHEIAQLFLDQLPQKAHILDIGCGPGRDVKIFADRGHNVTGIDFSSKAIEIAKRAVPNATFQIMDIESMAFPAGSFDGIWASASLLHIPKENLPSVFSKIHALLKSNGIFYVSVKKGCGERLEKDERYGDVEKFWSFFEEDELKSYLTQAGFNILKFINVENVTPYQTHPYLRALGQK